MSTVDVGLDEAPGLENAPVHMRLRSKVDYAFHFVLSNNLLKEFHIANVPADEVVAGIIGYVLQIVQVASIG